MTATATANAVRSIIRRASVTPQTKLNILTFCTHERYEQSLCRCGHNFYSIKSGKTWDVDYGNIPDNYFEIEELPHHVEYDLVLLQTFCNRMQIAAQLKNLLNIPILQHTHVLPDIRHEIDGQIKAFHQPLPVDYRTFISEFNQKAWASSSENSTFINHGIDTEFWNDEKPIERSPTCLSAVNLWPERDWCCGWELWKSTVGYQTSDQLPFTVVGKNDQWQLSSAAASLEELKTCYQSSLVFLNTSLHSPVPMSLLEAMACGCAVVSTNTCMIPEIIEHGYNGLLSNDPNELRAHCQDLLNNPNKAFELGQNAKKTIQEKYNLSRFTEDWNRVFYHVIKDYKD
tara:strand:+ start:13649 stop:14677 length:1029 start_codon:yes stop_codon:yes gene_type:complete